MTPDAGGRSTSTQIAIVSTATDTAATIELEAEHGVQNLIA